MIPVPQSFVNEKKDSCAKILREIQKRTGADIVNMRLNETGKTDHAPVFVGWVESEAVRNLRKQRKETEDPENSRFNDSIRPVKEYTDTLNAAAKAKKYVILERDWCAPISQKDPTATLSQKSAQQKALVPRAGLMYQKLSGIVINDGKVPRCVGTLNLAFARKPIGDKEKQAMKKAEQVLSGLLQSSNSDLTQFLQDNFELGGPIIS